MQFSFFSIHFSPLPLQFLLDKKNFLCGKNDVRTAIEQFYTPPPPKKNKLYPPNKFLATPLLSWCQYARFVSVRKDVNFFYHRWATLSYATPPLIAQTVHVTQLRMFQQGSGVTGSAYRRAEFTRGCYCACATYLHVKLVSVAHVRWAQITKRAYFTKARIKGWARNPNPKLQSTISGKRVLIEE